MGSASTTTQHLLRNADFEEVLDFQAEIESSFGIRFEEADFEAIQTFGQLCDVVQSRIKAKPVGDCTHQQAFYKIRDAVAATLDCDKRSIHPDSRLDSLIPMKGRKKVVAQIEQQLGFPLDVLGMNSVMVVGILIFLLGGIALLFFVFWAGVTTIAMGVLLARLFPRTLPVFTVRTVGKLARKVSSENYLKIRRNPETFNPHEIEGILRGLLVNRLGIDDEWIRRDAML